MNLIMNSLEKHTDLGDDSPISHDDHSEDDMRDCDSVSVDDEGGGVNNISSSRSSVTGIDMRTPEPQTTDVTINHPGHPHFPPNHPLSSLGSFMGMNGLHLQHGDVLEKLKMQVRDMKVGGLMDPDFSNSHSNFLANGLTQPVNTAFSLPTTSSLNGFSHSPQNLSQSHPHSISQLNSQQQQQHQQSQQLQTQSQSIGNGFSFVSPTTPTSCTKDANPASNSSTSSEASNSSQQNNGWSFEEQYKQVRQLYEINDDPKRKEFLDDLFSFMQKRGTPINRLPIMAKSVLDLYELYNLVIARGGLVDVINKKLWQEIIKGLHLPSSITSAAFTLRTQYMKYLYPYECDKKNLSSPSELQAAIDGNRREGRRSSYGHFETMPNPLQLPPISRSNVPSGMQQMSPLALVTHSNSQANAAMTAAAHHRLMGPGFGQMPGLMTHEIEQRMMEYLKLIQSQKEPPRPRSQSPSDLSTREALNALEMSRVALWQMYHNNTSPPSSVNTSPQGIEAQREALNLSESPPSITIKREREHNISTNDDLQPPTKRTSTNSTAPSHFHMPTPANSNSFSEDREEDEDDIDCDKNSTGGKPMESEMISHRRQTFHEKSPNYVSSRLHRQQIPSDDMSVFTGMQFKVVKKETTPSGEQQLSVVLDLNGTQYEGVLLSTKSFPSHSDKHNVVDGRTSQGGLLS